MAERPPIGARVRLRSLRSFPPALRGRIGTVTALHEDGVAFRVVLDACADGEFGEWPATDFTLDQSDVDVIGEEMDDEAPPIGLLVRVAMSDHDTFSPLSPAELRTLAREMEDALITAEAQFSHSDWRYVDGLNALAAFLESRGPAGSVERTGADTDHESQPSHRDRE